MKNWTSIAKATTPEIPAKDVSQIAATLNGLEQAFRPLVQDLTPEMEPAAVFFADEDRA